MPMFVKKPIAIEARQFTNETEHEILSWAEAYIHPQDKDCLVIPTLEGGMKAKKGDWIIRGVRGEFYPCREDIFNETYEKVENNS